MSVKTEKALELHKQGYNCAQCVACVFADELGKDQQAVFEIMEAFGFGMGHMGTCGAVSGMTAVAGMKLSDGNMDKPATKKVCYQASRALIEEFEAKNKSIICRELKGVDTGEMLRSCNGCITDAIEIVEKFLAEQK